MKLVLTDFGGDGPQLLLGPSLGTTVASVWRDAIPHLAEQFHVVGWDLPGHGRSPSVGKVTIADLAEAILADVEGTCSVAGVSLGGVVSLQMLLTAPDRVTCGTVLCTGARIGEPGPWHERAARVRSDGLGDLRSELQDRWFAPANVASDLAQTLLRDLATVDPGSYAALCDALAGSDLRPVLANIAQPVLAVAGAADQVAPLAVLRHIATGVQHGTLAVLESAGHLAPAEEPSAVAALIAKQVHATVTNLNTSQVRAQGMRVRREVLGDAHVDRASEGADAFTADFQDLITRYAWGEVWSRPGLDRRTRSMLTVALLTALGHEHELTMHLRAAFSNGLTEAEINEVLLQTAIYAGVPASNTAFTIARMVLAEIAQPKP